MKLSLKHTLPLALVMGVLTGLVFGPRCAVLGDISVVVIQFLKAIAAPLVFLATVDGVLHTDLTWKQGSRLIFICLANAMVACLIVLALDSLIPYGMFDLNSLREALEGMTVDTVKFQTPSISLAGVLESLLPKNILDPFISGQIISAVSLALFFGAALRLILRETKDETAMHIQAQNFAGVLSVSLRLVTLVLGWVVHIVPLAVFGVLAKVIGSHGFAPFASLILFAGVVVTGLFLQGVVYYSTLLWTFRRIGPIQFFRYAQTAIYTAIGTGSSLATLPVTLNVLENEMQVRKKNSRLAAVIGTNLNQDGIFIYEASVALILFHVMGIPITIEHVITVLSLSAVAAFGIGGIPDAGLISLSLVLSAVGLPLAAVPFLLPIDWFLGRLRAATNVTSDILIGNLLEAWDSRATRNLM